MGKRQTYLEIENFKNRIIDSTLLIGTIVGMVTWFVTHFPFMVETKAFNFYTDFLSFVILLSVYAGRRRLSIQIKSSAVLVVLLGFILTDAIVNGMYALNRVIIVVIPFYSLLVYKTRTTVVIYSFSILSYLFVGYFHVNGYLGPNLVYVEKFVSWIGWIESALIMSVVAIVIVIFTRRYHLELNQLIADLENKNEDLKKRESSLELEKAFNNKVIDSMPGIFNLFKKGEDGFKLMRWNTNTLRYSGLTEEELVEQDPLYIIHPEYRSKIQKVVENLSKGQFDGGSAKSWHAHDESISEWFYFSGFPTELDGEQYFLGTGIEISEQIQLEKLFKEEKVFSDRILDIIPGVFYLCEKISRGYKLVRWNKNLEKETGYAAEELTDFRPMKLFPPEYHSQMQSTFDELQDKGYAVIEAPIQKKYDTGDYWYFVNKKFKTHDKEYLIGVGFDIADRKVMERELEHRNLNLKDMLNDMQSRNQKLAEYAFINSHLLRAPLARILGLAEMVSKEVVLSEHQELIESFKTSAEELDAIVSKINEILDQRKDLNREEIVKVIEVQSDKNG